MLTFRRKTLILLQDVGSPGLIPLFVLKVNFLIGVQRLSEIFSTLDETEIQLAELRLPEGHSE
jgi:hypothetical protein